ncbi:hypothetical protein GCM10010435_44540 [Winogradskya consettensis]|uniref:Uncharacterized protein n=1 Tax=Winogradskya consettensis TaxID=113560 RepID=A0A919T2Q3_9ACTN|nr:hypothetical protein [Actinoplanes consettensis]GIM82720.1 hypothetical protein Aco04nite_82930 [Actinoplanes consettensis]
MKIRDVLLSVYGAGWAAAVGVALWRTGEVSPVLWAALAGGVGAILGAFRVEGTPPPPAAPAETTEDAHP